MERGLFLFLGLITHLVVEYHGQPEKQSEFVFRENAERVKSVSYVGTPNDGSSKQDWLNNLDSDTRHNLCREVKNRYSLFMLGSVTEEPHGYEMEDVYGNLKTVNAFGCRTTRDVWLRSGNSANEIIVIFLIHVAEEYRFDFEFVESIERATHLMPDPEDHWSREQLQKNYLNTLDINDRQNFCFWAHERVDIFTNQQRERNRDEEVFNGEYATIWEVGYKNSEKKKLVAIECRTQPRMFLRLVHSEDRSNKLIAMFLEQEANLSKVLPAEDVSAEK